MSFAVTNLGATYRDKHERTVSKPSGEEGHGGRNKMETIKNAIGMGTSQQEGQEPISGETGSADNATAPYDLGNADNKDLGGKAPQETAAVNNPVANMSAADTNASGMSNPPPTDDSAAQSPEAPEASKHAAKPAIGSASWFATAIPLRSKDAGSERQQQQPNGASGVSEPSKSPDSTANGGDNQPAAGVAIADLPPNQIGNDPPQGASTDFDKSIHPPSQVTSNERTTTGTNRDTAGPSDATRQSTEAQRKNRELKGSKAFAPAYEKPTDINSHKREGSIPSAGGVPIGQAAFEQRRASADVRRKSQISATGASAASSSAAAPPVESSPVTSTPAAAPPVESAPATTTSAPVTDSTVSPPHEPAVAAPMGDPDSVAPDDKRSVPTHEPPPPSTSVPKPEPVSAGGAGTAKTDDTAKTDGKEGRRGSLFDKIKNKLKS